MTTWEGPSTSAITDAHALTLGDFLVEVCAAHAFFLQAFQGQRQGGAARAVEGIAPASLAVVIEGESVAAQGKKIRAKAD